MNKLQPLKSAAGGRGGGGVELAIIDGEHVGGASPCKSHRGAEFLIKIQLFLVIGCLIFLLQSSHARVDAS